METQCPSCNKSVDVYGPGRHKCSWCGDSFTISEKKFSTMKESFRSVHATNSPSLISSVAVVFLWILSVLGFLLGLVFLAGNALSGAFALCSAFIILPPIAKLLIKLFHLRLMYVFIASIALFVAGAIILRFPPVKYFNSAQSNSTETQRIIPGKTEITTDDPRQILSYDCVNVTAIKIGEKDIAPASIEQICSGKYHLNLQSGLNSYHIEITTKSGVLTEDLSVTFDEVTYNAKLKAIADAKAQAEADAKAAEEAKLQGYATSYCANRKTATRKYGTFTISDKGISAEFSKGKQGRYLKIADCRAIIDTMIATMKKREGSVKSDILDLIIAGEYKMGMYEYYFFASAGNPDDINNSQYGSNEHDQVIYYKDSYGISANYYYFDNGVLTSTQDF